MTSKLFICCVVILGTSLPCAATVNMVVSTYDGMVVASDSRVIITIADTSRVLSDFGEKVKRVGSHVAVTFSGAAHLYDTEAERRNIGSIVDQYKSNTAISDSSYIDPRSVAVGLNSLFTDIYNKHQKVNHDAGLLQFAICGYDSAGERRIYKLLYPKLRKSSTKDRKWDVYGVLDSVFASGVPGAFPMGQDDVWMRLIKGYDPRLDDHEWFREVEIIVADSLDSTVVDTMPEKEKLNFGDLGYKIRYELMTLQDGIDFAVFIIRATIEAQRFNQASVQGVGGAIDIAVITPDGFKWIQHKQLHGEGAAPTMGH